MQRCGGSRAKSDMRILILSQWYPPEPMRLLSDMAESLRDLGHYVEVLTGFPNWPSGKVYEGYRVRLFQREEIGGVPILRIPLFPDHSRSASRRAANLASFPAAAMLLGPVVAERPDVIHVIQPPTTCAAGAVLSRLWGVPFTYEVQDMWPETLSATGMISSERLLSAVGRYCDWTYARAAGIRVISEGFRRNLIGKGVEPDKVRYIPNWVDVDYYRPLPRDEGLADELGMSGRFNVVYAGTIGPAQGLGVVLDAAEQLAQDTRVQFVLAGDGLDLERLTRDAERRRIPNVRFLGRRPGAEMPRLYSLSDALLVHLTDDRLFRMTVPHKTLTYLACGRPVLAAVDGDVADLVRRAHAGVCCAPSNATALAAAVRTLLEMPPALRAELGANGRSVAIQEFERGKVVSTLADFLTGAVAERSRPRWGAKLRRAPQG